MKGRIQGQQTTGDLSGSQFGTLEMLFHLGPMNQKDIGQKLLISKSNVVTVIDNLEKRGFVRRQRSEEDRRHVFVHLTKSGRQEIELILPSHVGAITEAMNRLSPQEQQDFGRLCRKLGRGQ